MGIKSIFLSLLLTEIYRSQSVLTKMLSFGNAVFKLQIISETMFQWKKGFRDDLLFS